MPGTRWDRGQASGAPGPRPAGRTRIQSGRCHPESGEQVGCGDEFGLDLTITPRQSG